MKRILSFAISFVMLCFVLGLFAFSAETYEGISGSKDYHYYVNEPLSDMPRTVEATVWFNKRMSNVGGSILGNFRGFSKSPDFALSVDSMGKLKLRMKDGHGEYHTQFDNPSVIKSAWVHVAIAFDEAKKEIRCYIDGELVQTEKLIADLSLVGTWDMVIGSSMAFSNAEYLNGKIKNVAFYSDVRTADEIKSDMTSQGKDNLILHYDMSSLDSATPATLKDKSGKNNDATLNRILFDGLREPVTDYAYSFAVVGDTQSLAINYPDHFKDIYQWIAENIEAKNIEMVLGLGDITDTEVGDNTVFEWELAKAAFGLIDDKVAHIPIRGNHDSIFHYNKYMEEMNYAKLIDGRFSDTALLNTYVEMEIGSIPYLFVVLDYALTEAQLDWACKVVASHPNHNVIVLRHAYMNHDYRPLQENGEMDPTVLKRGYLSGQIVWDKLISQYENIVLSLSGHIGSDLVVTRQLEGVHGNTVTEMLIDFQASDNAATKLGYTENGLGIVNMFYFSEDGKTLSVRTYSTVLDKYYYDINQFTVELDMHTDSKYQGDKPAITEKPAEKTVVKMTLDSLTATVNGESKTLDAAPVIKNSRTMLPVRFVAENLGATVGWDAATQTVSIKSETTTIEIVIGATTAKVNGNVITLDSPAYIEPSNNRTYLPVRVVAENLGATVAWDDATKTATLTK